MSKILNFDSAVHVFSSQGGVFLSQGAFFRRRGRFFVAGAFFCQVRNLKIEFRNSRTVNPELESSQFSFLDLSEVGFLFFIFFFKEKREKREKMASSDLINMCKENGDDIILLVKCVVCLNEKDVRDLHRMCRTCSQYSCCAVCMYDLELNETDECPLCRGPFEADEEVDCKILGDVICVGPAPAAAAAHVIVIDDSDSEEEVEEVAAAYPASPSYTRVSPSYIRTSPSYMYTSTSPSYWTEFSPTSSPQPEIPILSNIPVNLRTPSPMPADLMAPSPLFARSRDRYSMSPSPYSRGPRPFRLSTPRPSTPRPRPQ